MSPRLQYLLAVIVALLGIAGACLIIDFSVFDTDEPYQAVQCLDYRTVPVAPLTDALGYGWMQIFGRGILQLRVLALIFTAIMAGAGAVYLQRRLHRPLLSACAFSFIVLLIGSNGIYDWNITSECLLTLTLYATLAWWNKPALPRTILVALLAALTALMRAPSAVTVAAVVIVMLCHRRYKQAAICTIVAAAVGILGIVCIYGSTGAYLDLLNSDSVTSLHDSAYAYFRFFKMTGRRILYPALWSIVFMGIMADAMRLRSRALYVAVSLVVGAMVSYMVFRYGLHRLCDIRGMVYPAFIVMLLAPILRGERGSALAPRRHIIIILATFSLLQMPGSNVWLNRFMALAFLPFAIPLLTPPPLRFRRLWAMAVFAAMMVGITYVSQQWYFCRLSASGPMRGRYEARATGMLRGLKFDEYHRDFINENLPLLQRADSLMILGNNKYLCRLLMPDYQDYAPQRFEYYNERDSTAVCAEIERALPRYSTVALVGSEFHGTGVVHPKNLLQPRIEALLRRHGFAPADSTGFDLWIWKRVF